MAVQILKLLTDAFEVRRKRKRKTCPSLQALMQEALEWRRVAEANGNLTRRFEETRAELEKTLRVGQACLTERGDPAELFSKHSVCRSIHPHLTKRA